MATKSVKKATKKVNKTVKQAQNSTFAKNFNKIKETAITLNSQVLDAANDVVDVAVESGEQLRTEAVKTAKTTYKKVNEVVNVKNIKNAATKVNNYTITTADELVDEALVSGEKWQGITKKAVKGSLKLAAKQQDIVFDTLETVKDQFAGNFGRFRKLFSRN